MHEGTPTIIHQRSVVGKKQSEREIFVTMREIVHLQVGQCGNQIGAKVSFKKTPLFNYSANMNLAANICGGLLIWLVLQFTKHVITLKFRFVMRKKYVKVFEKE